MRIFNIITVLVFTVFAGLQFNDPDPVVWISIYGYVAVIAILDLFKIHPVIVIFISIIAGVIYTLFYISGVMDLLDQGSIKEITAEMEATKPYVEETREFLGLLIAIIVLLFYYFKRKGDRRRI